MSTDDSQNPERDLRDKIASRMRSITQSSKQIPPEQLQKLKTAATRLDLLIKSNADQDQQALKSAAQKLDQLLSKIRKGRDVAQDLKRKDHPASGE